MHLYFSEKPDRDEDLFAATRMPFGEHLEALRWHLGRAVAGFAAILGLVLTIDFAGHAAGLPIGVGKPLLEEIARPVEQALDEFHERRARRLADRMRADVSSDLVQEVPLQLNAAHLARVLAPLLKLPPPDVDDGAGEYVTIDGRIPPRSWALALEEAQRRLSPRATLKTMGATEGMMVYFKVALVCGLVLGSPWIFWQLWMFVAAGLYPHEKRLVHVYLPFSLGLFLGGVALCQFVVIPKAVSALLWFNEWLGFEPDLRLSEWIGFAVLMPLVFGLAFQTPLVMRCVERLGILSAADYRSKRRLAWFLMAFVAALITPTIDVLSCLLLWLPLGVLYEAGILLCAEGTTAAYSSPRIASPSDSGNGRPSGDR
jgi:sec-independent protein translocase protein TatC